MAWTKRQLVAAAFEEIGLANYEFDLTPEQIQGALRRLDAMMAVWNTKGVRIGYALASTPEGSSLDDDSGVSDDATQAIYTNLALRIAPTIGKQVSAETRIDAKNAYDALIGRVVSGQMREQQFPQTLPVGAGNKPWRYNENFMPLPTDPLQAGPDSDLEFIP